MDEIKSPVAENFSITRGGPLHWLIVHLFHPGESRQRVVFRALFAVLVSWVPMLALSLMQGQAFGTLIEIPFLRDLAVNVRFLISVPILILAESGIDQKLRHLVLQFLSSGLVPEKELPSFETVIEGTTRLRDRVLPEVLLLIAAISMSFILRTELLMNSVSNWHFAGAGSDELSLAGWWFTIVSAPLYRFLLFRWLWRMVIWTTFLWRVSRIKLYLVATHADMAAGLGFLSMGQTAFNPIIFAGGAVIAAQVGNAIAYQGATLSSQKFPMIGYGLFAIIVLVAPLLVVSPVLLKIKRKALLEYGALVTVHNQLFDAKWVQEGHPTDEVMLGNPDASSLIDLGSSFTVIREMILVPINRRTLITLAVAAALPMVPVILFATPADQLMQVVLKMLG